MGDVVFERTPIEDFYFDPIAAIARAAGATARMPLLTWCFWPDLHCEMWAVAPEILLARREAEN